MEALGMARWRRKVGALREMDLRRATYFERWKLFVLVSKVMESSTSCPRDSVYSLVLLSRVFLRNMNTSVTHIYRSSTIQVPTFPSLWCLHSVSSCLILRGARTEWLLKIRFSFNLEMANNSCCTKPEIMFTRQYQENRLRQAFVLREVCPHWKPNNRRPQFTNDTFGLAWHSCVRNLGHQIEIKNASKHPPTAVFGAPACHRHSAYHEKWAILYILPHLVFPKCQRTSTG